MKKIITGGVLYGVLLLIAAPQFVSAAADLAELKTLVKAIGEILNFVVPITITLALIVFFWGLIGYLYRSDSDDSRKEATRRMIGGILVFFVIVSLWGLTNFLEDQLGLSSPSTEIVPGFNFINYGAPGPG